MDNFYLGCFWDLSSTRRYEAGPIPWDRAVEYGRHRGLDDDIINAFVDIMRAMDDGYLGWMAEEAERRRRAGK